MANLKITKGNITIDKKPNPKAEALGGLFHIGGFALMGIGFLVSCTNSLSNINTGGFDFGSFILFTILGLFVFFIGDVIKLMTYSASPQYQCTIEELEGTIDNMDVTIKNSIKIDGMVEADLKKISIPKPVPSKIEPKTTTSLEPKT